MDGNVEDQITPAPSLKQKEEFKTSLRYQPEIRDYATNQEMALKKLRDSADRSGIVVEKTGGGLTLKLNTGVYQLVKSAAHQFYTSES